LVILKNKKMKNNKQNNYALVDLNLKELNEINGGGLLFDLLYKVGTVVGDTISGTQEFLNEVSKTNPNTLNSGTYYGR